MEGDIIDFFPSSKFKHIETNLNHVFLSNEYVFKFKKNVKFPFADQSTKELRKELCLKEVQLNKRFSPDLYLGVVSIKNGEMKFHAEDVVDEEADEFGVKMKRFEKECDEALGKGLIGRKDFEIFAEKLADIHKNLPIIQEGGTGSMFIV